MSVALHLRRYQYNCRTIFSPLSICINVALHLRLSFEKGGASDDDDDCLVLDSDPDKLVLVVYGKGDEGGDGGDDLLIVAEKGQVGIVLSFFDVVYALMYSTRAGCEGNAGATGAAVGWA
ncbi:hypothetical protein BHE74_00020250 [Ensete ventricosum]|nr:hypothetical protein BHE74_00020250 [Ensete ventricosum]